MNSNRESPAAQMVGKKLTAREQECLALVGEGMSSKEIARHLDITHNTVDARVKSACSKLGTNSRAIAAQMVAGRVTVTPTGTNLVYDPMPIPHPRQSLTMALSAEEGDSSDEIAPQDLIEPESGDSGIEGDQRGSNNLIATFFGGQKNLSIGRQLIYIVGIAMASLIAFGALVNGLIGLSKVISPP